MERIPVYLSEPEEPYIYRVLQSDPELGLTNLLEIDACRRLLYPVFHNATGLAISFDSEGKENGVVLRFPLPPYTLKGRLCDMNKERRIAVLGAIGHALAILHSEGLYHGNVSEENIGILSGDTPLLTSWIQIGRGKEGRQKDVQNFLDLLSRIIDAPKVSFNGPIQDVLALPLFSLVSPLTLRLREEPYSRKEYTGKFRDLLKLGIHLHRKIPESDTKALFLSCDILYRVGSSLQEDIVLMMSWMAASVWIGLKFSQPDGKFPVGTLTKIMSEESIASVSESDVLRAEIHIVNILRGCIWRPHLYSASRSSSQLKYAFDEFILKVPEYLSLDAQTIAIWADRFPSPSEIVETTSSELQNVPTSTFFL